jgi:hypothetical protein
MSHIPDVDGWRPEDYTYSLGYSDFTNRVPRRTSTECQDWYDKGWEEAEDENPR